MNSETPVPIVDPDSNEGDPSGNDDVREPLVPVPGSDQLPGPDDDVDPEDGGGHIKKQTGPSCLAAK